MDLDYLQHLTTDLLGSMSLSRWQTKFYVSATPSKYEMEHSVAFGEQVIRPTGLVDPEIEIRPKGQIDDLLFEINERVKRKNVY